MKSFCFFIIVLQFLLTSCDRKSEKGNIKTNNGGDIVVADNSHSKQNQNIAYC